MTTKFNIMRDINGVNGFGLIPSDTKYSITLPALTVKTLTLPASMGMSGNGISTSSQWVVLFEFDTGVNVYVAYGQTAEVPAGNTFAATTSEKNPQARLVAGGTVLSFISPTECDVTVCLYSFS